MINLFTRIVDFIEFISVKIHLLRCNEYALKLEEYYYNKKSSLYIIVLRFRNKNAVIKMNINQIVKNESLINSLHPHDSYVIGTVKTMQENGYIINHPFINRDFGDYYVIDPCVEWVGTDLIENKLIFKAKSSLSEIKVSIEEFHKNFNLLHVLSSKSTFLIGSMVSSSYIQDSI